MKSFGRWELCEGIRNANANLWETLRSEIFWNRKESQLSEMELRIETLWNGKEGQLPDLEMRIETLWNGKESQLSGL